MNTPSRLLPLLAALALAVGVLVHTAHVPVARGAAPEVPIVTATTITIVPEQNRVRYTIDATLYQHIADTATTIYYVNEAYLGVLPGAVNVHASAGGGTLSASVDERHEDYDVIRVRLGRNVYHNQSYRFRVSYDLSGIGADAALLTQADESFTSLVVTPHGTPDTAGQTVTVVLPPGFELGSTFGEIPEPTVSANGESVFAFGEQDFEFWAVMTAQNFSKLNKVDLTATVGDNQVEILLRGWADDQAWADSVGPLFEEGLPILSERIGLPYDREGTLIVDEVLSWVIGGYAGIFDPTTRIIQVSSDADGFVTLHEAAHAWFNGSLVTDRWAGEAFASWYALKAAAELDVDTTGYEPVDPGEKLFVLNEWPALGDAQETDETYGYNASVYVASLISARAGTDLPLIWQAIANHDGAYQPRHAKAPERGVIGAADSRHLLDLLDERTTGDFDDIFETWILAPSDSQQLDERADARELYGEVVDHAGSWELPKDVRIAMDQWEFADATTELESADGVLDSWDAVTGAAEDLDLSPPDDIQVAFEAGEWAAAGTEAEAELETLDHVAAADKALAVEPSFVETVGLIGSDPAADLAAAETAYESGDLEASTTAAESALATREAASESGTLRLGIGGGGLILIVLAGGAFWFLVRPRRNRADEASPAAPASEDEGPTEA